MKKQKLIGTLLLFFIFMMIVASAAFFALKSRGEINSAYSNLDLRFEGVVYDKTSLDHTRGMLHLNIIYSSTDFYDVRDKKNIYLCVIRNDKIDLITSGLHVAEKGDTVIVDTSIANVQLIRDNKVIDNWNIYRSDTFGAFYSYRKMHKI